MRLRSSNWPCSSRTAAVWEALWGSTPIVTGMQTPFWRANKDTGRAGRLGAGQSSVEPLSVGCRQDRTTVLEPTQGRVAVGVVERPAGTLEPYGCSPGLLPAIQ